MIIDLDKIQTVYSIVHTDTLTAVPPSEESHEANQIVIINNTIRTH
jgi:hypothetical protein